MSNLRKSIKRPETYLAILFLLLILAALDTFRSPERQVTGWFYVQGVYIYQAVGRPLLKDTIQCRFQPTCSDYSIEAVQKHGVIDGLKLTYNRLNFCQTNVPFGTPDPVP